MFDIYDYVDSCKEQGMDSREALIQLDRERSEYNEERIEMLEERQLKTAWQQDLIDLYRFER